MEKIAVLAPDSERQNEDGNRGEAGGLSECPKGVDDVQPESSHRCGLRCSKSECSLRLEATHAKKRDHE